MSVARKPHTRKRKRIPPLETVKSIYDESQKCLIKRVEAFVMQRFDDAPLAFNDSAGP